MSAGSPPPVTRYAMELQGADGRWAAGLPLALGFVWDPSHELPEPYVLLGGTDISSYVALTVNEQRRLVLSFDLRPIHELACANAPPLYLAATAIFELDGSKLSGQVTATCDGASTREWQGACDVAGAAWLVNLWVSTVELAPRLGAEARLAPAPRLGAEVRPALALQPARSVPITPPLIEEGMRFLIGASDDLVRQQLAVTFAAQLRSNVMVRGTFFAAEQAEHLPYDPAHGLWVGSVASALVALALAQTSQHGFAQTIDRDKAQQFLVENLAPSNATFLQVMWQNYQLLFAEWCRESGVPFRDFSSGTLGDPPTWGKLLADALTSPAYIDAQMIKLNPAVDSGGWYQVFYSNVYKVTLLDAGQRQRVLDAWAPYLKGKEVPGAVPWTYYDHVLAACFGASTFQQEVGAAIAVTDVHSEDHGSQGGMGGVSSSVTVVTYGRAVNDWLAARRDLGFVRGPSGSNVEHHHDSW